MTSKKINGIALLKGLYSSGSPGALMRAVIKFPGMRVISFNRGDLATPEFLKNKSFEVSPGPNGDGKLVSRISSAFQLIVKLIKYRSEKHEFVVAGSLELAFICQLVLRRTTKKYYLFSDISRHHLNIKSGWLIRSIERFCISNGWIPCVTSPGFSEGYLLKILDFVPETLLVHNSVLDIWRTDELLSVGNDFSNRRFSIVWTGLIRCQISIDLILELSEKMEDEFDVNLAGSLDYLPHSVQKKIHLAGCIKYLGGYAEDDLPRIYSRARYGWCCDWSMGVNSKLLIPNRLYQSVAACCPVIVSSESWLNKVITMYDIGIAIPTDLDKAFEILSNITSDDYSRMVANCRKLYRSVTVTNGGWDAVLLGKGSLVTPVVMAGKLF